MVFCKLTLLSTEEPINIYEEIAKSKHTYKSILYGTDSTKSSTYKIVKDCYSSYETNKDKLENISPYPSFNISQKEALLHCYTGNTKKVKSLKNAIISSQNIYYRTKCAYCGIGDSKYMDHYLPKDDFPEYSIHSYNLVPSCSYCNEKKSKLFLDADGVRKIFNPYFELIEDIPILKCDLICSDTTLKSKLKLMDDLNNKVWKNNLDTLDIITRYEAELPRVLTSIMFDIIVNFEENGIDPDGAKRVLRRKLKECEQIQGFNSLDAVVFRAYLEHEELFDINYIRKIYISLRNSSETAGITAK